MIVTTKTGLKVQLTAEKPYHHDAIEALLDDSFGDERFFKTVSKLRNGQRPIADLSLVALLNHEVVGTIKYWPLLIGENNVQSLMLGPIAISDKLQGTGIGKTLITESMKRAQEAGFDSIILVGDAPYYNRFGFTRELTKNLDLPGPYDTDRFLGHELRPGALLKASGMVRANPAFKVQNWQLPARLKLAL